MPNRDWGRDDDERWTRDDDWRRARRGDYRESGFGFGGTDRGFGGGGYGGYGNYGERGWGDRGWGYGSYRRPPDYDERWGGGPSMAEREMGDRGAYERRWWEERYGRPRWHERQLGRPPRGYQRSDERVKEDLCDRLMHSWIDADDVVVDVRAGEVTLTGTVEDRASKRAIEDVADDILGVKDVHNQIRVRQRELERGERAPVSATVKKPSA